MLEGISSRAVTNPGEFGRSPEPARPDESSSCEITARALLDLLDRQSDRCALTGRLLVPEVASIDHITPLSKGGEHSIENIQILHNDVNQAKRTMAQEEFIQLCREVVAWADRPLNSEAPCKP